MQAELLEQAKLQVKQAFHSCQSCEITNIKLLEPTVQINSVSPSITALVPVYTLEYSYAGKLYHVTMNGHSGKVVGQSPVASSKLFTIAAVGGALAIGAFFLFGWMGSVGGASSQ